MKKTPFVARTLALSIAFACSAQAADFPSAPPEAGPAPKVSIPNAVETTLPNGLRVITVTRAGLPLVTTNLMVRAGAEHDPADKSGLTYFTGELITKGAKGRSAAQIAEAAEALGGSLDVTTGWDASGVDITVATPKLDAAMALMSDTVLAPDYAQEELERLRTQTLNGLKQSMSRPNVVSSLALSRVVYGAHTYGHPASGTPQSLPKISRDDVAAQYKAMWRPDQAILLFAGDITPAQAKALASQYFGQWTAPNSLLPTAPAKPVAGGKGALWVINQPGAGQSGVSMGVQATARKDKDYYAGTLANAILGGSYSARLNQEIRIKRGLSYGANSRLQSLAAGGAWTGSALTKNPSSMEVVDLMRTEALRLGKEPVAADEFTARQATLTGNYAMGLESTDGLSSVLGNLAVQGIDLQEANRFIDRINAVTPAQVQSYAGKYFKPGGLNFVVVGDTKDFETKIPAGAERLDVSKLKLDSPDLGK